MKIHGSLAKILLMLLCCLVLVACGNQPEANADPELLPATNIDTEAILTADDDIIFLAPDVHQPFGGDKSASAGNANVAINELYRACFNQPETLASTMSACPSRVEKAGLTSADPNYLDDAMDAEDGGEVQWVLLDELKGLLEDPTTKIEFSQWKGKVKMLYMVKRDENAKSTPDNIALTWEYVQLEDYNTIMTIAVPREDGTEDIGYFDMNYGFQRLEPIAVTVGSPP